MEFAFWLRHVYKRSNLHHTTTFYCGKLYLNQIKEKVKHKVKKYISVGHIICEITIVESLFYLMAIHFFRSLGNFEIWKISKSHLEIDIRSKSLLY